MSFGIRVLVMSKYRVRVRFRVGVMPMGRVRIMVGARLMCIWLCLGSGLW